MAKEAVALIGLAALVSLSQWLFTNTAARVGMPAIPADARPRVRWLLANSAHIHLACGATALAAVVVQTAVLIG